MTDRVSKSLRVTALSRPSLMKLGFYEIAFDAAAGPADALFLV